jgi:phosphoglycerate kinase
VVYCDDLLGSKAKKAVGDLEEGELVLLENVRFFAEEITLKNCSFEKQAKSHLVKGLTPLAQYFVHDAFAAAHRCQPSLTGFTHTMPSCAGRLMQKEIDNLSKALDPANKPRIVILGGAKFDDSIAMADHMLSNNLADVILTGGAVANFYMYAAGIDIGKPSTEFLFKECGGDFEKLLVNAQVQLKKFKNSIKLPSDVAVNADGKRVNVKVPDLPAKESIFDIGLDTIVTYSKEIAKAKGIVVNGPMGVFEVEEFAMGTEGVFNAVGDADAYKVAGGGHTSATFENLGLAKKMDHISSGGGASLTFLAGGDMPGISALVENKKNFKGCKLP